MQDIVAAAVAEFLEKGYENASMEAIASRAGLTKGGLYHHFRGKDEILGYANLRLTEPVEALASRASKSPSALQGLRGYIAGYVRFWAAHPRQLAFFFLTITKALQMPTMRQLYAEYYRSMHRTFAALFRRAIAQGALRPHDPAARAFALMAALDGATAYQAFEVNSGAATRIIARLEEVFLGDLAVQGLPSPEKASNRIRKA